MLKMAVLTVVLLASGVSGCGDNDPSDPSSSGTSAHKSLLIDREGELMGDVYGIGTTQFYVELEPKILVKARG